MKPLIFSSFADQMAWQEIPQPGAKGFATYSGPITLHRMRIETTLLITMRDDGLFPWIERMRVDLFQKHCSPGIQIIKLAYRNDPRLDCQHEVTFMGELLTLIGKHFNATSFQELFRLYKEHVKKD